MDLKLAGRNVLVTGGSKGIGLAVAHQFALEGCNLGLVARSAADLSKAADKIRAAVSVQVHTFAADLTRSSDRDAVTTGYAHADILVNNAGAVPPGTLETIDDAKWRAGWDLKVFGYINMTRDYFARMKARGHGVIVNIIGIGGERLDSGYIAGAAGNAALTAFTKALGSTSAEHGIRVLGVSPGPVETERLVMMQRTKAKARFGDEERWREFYNTMPFGRAATPDEIAAAVVFLASDLSSYTTGTVVTIDGGLASRGALP